jgi:hypothetical protein
MLIRMFRFEIQRFIENTYVFVLENVLRVDSLLYHLIVYCLPILISKLAQNQRTCFTNHRVAKHVFVCKGMSYL